MLGACSRRHIIRVTETRSAEWTIRFSYFWLIVVRSGQLG
jgi:hypothetical protein